jgi:hypothetical protein
MAISRDHNYKQLHLLLFIEPNNEQETSAIPEIQVDKRPRIPGKPPVSSSDTRNS